MARRRVLTLLMTSLAPLPVATLSNRELGGTGQNYLKSLFAVGFQGMLILVCVAIYAVLVQGIDVYKRQNHSRRQNGAGTGSGSRCYTGADLSGVNRGMEKRPCQGA